MRDETLPMDTMPPRERRYPSDMSDVEWQLIQPFVAPGAGAGAPRTVETRAVMDALRYRLRTGCQWRQLPADFPKWPTGYYYLKQWSADGTWERINTALREQDRAAAGVTRSQVPRSSTAKASRRPKSAMPSGAMTAASR